MYIVETTSFFTGWYRVEDAEFEELDEALDFINMQEQPETYRVIKIIAQYEIEKKLIVKE